MTRQEWLGIVVGVFGAAAVVVAVLACFGERVERRNEQRFERIEAAIEAFARDSRRRDERIEATLETVARDIETSRSLPDGRPNETPPARKTDVQGTPSPRCSGGRDGRAGS